MRQPLEMLDRQVLIGEWTARRLSTHWPISGGCEHPLQQKVDEIVTKIKMTAAWHRQVANYN